MRLISLENTMAHRGYDTRQLDLEKTLVETA